MVHLLLSNGANPSLKDITNYAPIHYATNINNKKIVLDLIKHGAELNQSSADWMPLHFAAHMGFEDMAKCLIKNGALIESKTVITNKMTSLIIAASRNQKSIVSLSIKYGANVNAKDIHGIHGQAGGRMGGENFPQGKFSRNF